MKLKPKPETGDLMELEKLIPCFDRLLAVKAAVTPFTYCTALKSRIETERLKGEICLRCPYFILKGGLCDPL